MADWKDTTAYSKSEDRETQEARIWRTTRGDLGISVHRYVHKPGKWFLSCYDLNINRYRLDSEDIEDAKSEAIEHIRARLEECLRALDT